jgi:hypothetical protein
LLLEVKGGRVACKNGLWEFTDRYGHTNKKKESPAAQAGTALFSLEKNYLKPRFGRELGAVPVGWGVVFTDIPRLTHAGVSDLPEHPDEITAYDVDCRGHNTFRDYLERAFDHWASTKTRPRELPPSVISSILTALRPNFERVPPLNNQLRHVERDLCQFTDEQYQRMDEIAENDRIMIDGGAGTGKTFIAAACARYEGSSGRQVLFVTRSPFLGSFLKTLELPPAVTVASFAEVPSLAIEHGPWDALIVDEGQDLCNPDAIDTLDKTLNGGWEKGRWRWFGDPNHQVSPSYPLDEDCYEYLRSMAVKCRLKQNVRNAGRVIEAIEAFSGAHVGEPRGDPQGGRVTLEHADSVEELRHAVTKTLKGWLTGEGAAERSEAVVLLDETQDPEALAREISSRGIRAEALSERALGKSPRDCVLVARIEDFKGLERPLACVAGLGDVGASLAANAYKALSRANHQLVVVAPTATLQALANKLAQQVASNEVN